MKRFHVAQTVWLSLLLVTAASPAGAAAASLVANGSFEEVRPNTAVPAFWAAAGNARLKQELTLDKGRDGKRCARLACTEFAGDGPDFHAMICQVGTIALRRGQWYRLTCWAKGQAIRSGSVEIGLSDTRRWANAGLADAFTPTSEWQRFEFRFQASQDLPAENSRLQFWFKSTGTLWLDDVELIESEAGQQWFPQIVTAGVKNAVPNSSFECGAANWGSYTWGLSGWAGNLYRLEGAVVETPSPHGRHCLRISLAPDTLPVFHFDYYEPVRQPVRRVLAANHGWFRVKPGEKLTLSAWLRTDAEGAVAQLAAVAPGDRLQRKAVKPGRNWERFEFSFSAAQPFVFIAVGLDLEASQQTGGTLWIDAVQLEQGDRATDYEPRAPVESFLAAEGSHHLYSDPAKGVEFLVRSFNNTDEPQALSGRLSITDFFDRVVFTQSVEQTLEPHSHRAARLSGLAQGRRGFFRAEWLAQDQSNTLRCAVLDPSWAGAADSPFGFNHAYPWDFLVELAQQAGVKWWRDWSAQWNVVQPAEGPLDFRVPDEQIFRVLKLKGKVDILLPFPSARWASTARQDEVEKAAEGNRYLRTRLPVAYAPSRLDDFGRYAAAVAEHYGQTGMDQAVAFEILNEPIYTDYALPRKFGYGLEDYLRLLEVAHRAIKSANPNARVVGGIGANLTASLTHDFIARGGLKFVDALDVHLYDAARPAEGFEESFRALNELMQRQGGSKPVWITEWGCYADDDPACVPHTVGDATMNRCRWPNERAASEHIVKFAAVAFAHGVRKIFFHAGTCGAINGPDAGGVLFEYGGAPRKMLPAVAAFTGLVGVPEECVYRLVAAERCGFVFRARNGAAAVVWARNGTTGHLRPPRSIRAYDIMGNELPGPPFELGSAPIYLLHSSTDELVNALTSLGPL
ncbi:MAG TPA: carbohydrate binding domain-containing protein [Candidatus Paceibacterota bacterium]|nr:carbohydrate binding domain-containing protein [Candidatus Paceibacterota bacterium]